MSLAQLSIRTYARYLVPLTLLSLIAFSPMILFAYRVQVPLNPKAAQVVLRMAYAFAGCSVIPLYLLVAGVAPAVLGLASGAPRSQLAVLVAGLVGLARAIVPILLVVAAVAIGSLAVVVPGLILLVLLALTGASVEDGGPARLADSIAIVRTKILPVASVIVAVIAVQAATIYLLSRPLVPLPKKPPADLLVAFQHLLRLTGAGLALVAPLPAIVLAAIYARARLQRS